MARGNKQMKKIWYEIKRKMNIENTYFSWIGILSVFLIVGGFSFALFSIYQESRGSLNIITGNLYGYIESEDFSEGESVHLQGHEKKIIFVTQKNTNEQEVKLNLYYTKVEGVEVGYSKEKDTPPDKEGMIFQKEEEKVYKIVIRNDTEEEKIVEFGSEVGFSSKELPFPEGKEILTPCIYEEEILKGSDPVLKDPLIPVTIDPSGKVTYADLTDVWYKYEEKKWANAVILVDHPSKEYQVGNQIDEQDIESYFVWIPRYKYQIFDVGNYQTTISVNSAPTSIAKTINIEFQNKNDDKEEGTQKGEYLTHPAFTLGGKELSGIWVGKFETGYNQTGDGSKPIDTTGWNTENAQEDELNENKIIVKPNVYSWRNITVSKMFMNAYKYNRDLDSHMMKNMEWGAVAYLSHSNYGTGKEVNVNNNSSYLTGYSSTEEADQSSFPGINGTEETDTQSYNNETGYKASTTGNITGVYDMSGGCHEYMAAYRTGQNSTDSEVTDAMLSDYANYFDVYGETTSWDDYSKRKLGDATGEMGPLYYYKDKDDTIRSHNAWYADHSYIVDLTYPWFTRGGSHSDGVLTGQFNFRRDTGGVFTYIGSRLVLSID